MSFRSYPLLRLAAATTIVLGPSCSWGIELLEVAGEGGPPTGGEGGEDQIPATGGNAPSGGLGGAGQSGGTVGIGEGGAASGGTDAGSGGSASGGGTGGTIEDIPFNPPSAVEEIFVGTPDDDPSFTDDLLELYFSTTRGTAEEEVWVTTRASVGDPWAPPSPVAAVNDGSVNSMPGVTSDGLTLYFIRWPAGMGSGRDIYVTTRADRASPWGTPELFGASVPGSADSSPCGTSDRLTLFWGRGVSGKAEDVVMSERASVLDAWSTYQSVPGISDVAPDGEPWISDSKLHVYFRSTRNGSTLEDIYTASRASADVPFDPPTRVDELSTEFGDADPWLSQDRRTIMFTSTRSGVSRIYVATRP